MKRFTLGAVLASGHKVAATARVSDGVADKIGGIENNLLVLQMDVTDIDSIESAVMSARRAFVTINVLVNNAGYGQLGCFETVSLNTIEHQFKVNVYGLMEVTRRALLVMRSQKCGHIFNIASIGGARGYSGSSVCCASKFAVEGYSEGMAAEAKPFGIKKFIFRRFRCGSNWQLGFLNTRSITAECSFKRKLVTCFIL